MADVRTPLPIHRVAFARIAPTLNMPSDNLEELRKAFQAAERNGDPRREWRDVSDTVAHCIWSWPWMEDSAQRFAREGIWPLRWLQDKVPCPLDWHQVTHAARVQLLLYTLHGAVSTEKALAAFKENKRDNIIPGRLSLETGDRRCAASIDAEVRFQPQVAGGNLSVLPPFFPGDATELRFDLDISRRRR
jgi:hypothetical protein